MRALFAFLWVPTVAFSQPNGGHPVDITSEKLTITQAQGQAVFSGNVVVTQNNLTLKAPILTVTYNQNGGEVEELEASGGVVVTRGAQGGGVAETARGDTATYTLGQQQVVFTGRVQLTRGPHTLEGDRLVYNVTSGNAQVTNSQGPVRARFVAATSPSTSVQP